MDVIHTAIIVAAAGLVLGGARMLYCGHKSIRAGRHDRRTKERRRDHRTTDRRHPE